MHLPQVEWLGAAYGLSEALLGLVRRSRGGTANKDRGSLRMLWVVILASVMLAVLLRGLVPAGDSALLHRLYAVGVALFAAGLALRWTAIAYLGRFFTVDVAIAADHRVVDSGPYRWLRHPSYAGAILAFIGLGICFGNWLSLLALVVPITAVFVHRIRIEEAALLAGLGNEYVAYAARSWRLLPFVY